MPDWEADIESGAVFSGYNDIQIPNEIGTRFSLTDDISTDSRAFWRLRFSGTFSEKHTVSILIAPLTFKANGTADIDISYNNILFPAGEQLNADYKFNSYRLTYRYRIAQSQRFKFGIGFTAKIRDAVVRLRDSQNDTEYTNTGFVPLLNFRLKYLLSFSNKFIDTG